MLAEIGGGTELVVGDPEILWERPYYDQGQLWSYYVAPDGRFLMMKGDAVGDGAVRLELFLDWLGHSPAEPAGPQ